MDKLERVYKDILYLFKDKNRDDIEVIRSLIIEVGKNLIEKNFYYDNYLLKETFNSDLDRYYSKFSSYSLKLDEKENLYKIISRLDSKDYYKFELGKLYQKLLSKSAKKKLGQVYTPKDIVDGMIDNVITKDEIIKNPYLRIIDPACGGGYFLSSIFLKLKCIFQTHKKEIIRNHKSIEKEYKNIDKFILRNNIWGVDIDEFSLYMSTVSLLLKSNIFTKLNLINTDILLDKSLDNKFDVTIGNPPYIGQKKLTKDYKIKLKENYKDVFQNKSDISYCFFYKSYNLLKENGIASFITSRYFIEAQSSNGLRNFINDNFFIEYIKDYYGKRAFKGVGVSPLIINLKKNSEKNNRIKVEKYYEKKIDNFVSFTVNQNNFDENGWILIDNKSKKLFNKIDSIGEYYLWELCTFNQGIITGCDKAFIVDKREILDKNLEVDIIKPWIKNSNINRYNNLNTSKYILYTDLINEISDYKNTIKYVKKFKDKLNNRRECKNGVRKWYQLQWGRNLEIFKSPKIMFPFKSSGSNFTIDYNDVLCSADIYLINTKDSKISLEYLLAFLNSNIFEFYFKCQAKKVGENLYEYYPNKIKNMKIKIANDKSDVISYVKKVLYIYNKKVLSDEDKLNIKNLEHEINRFFYKLYKLNDNEIGIIEKIIY